MAEQVFRVKRDTARAIDEFARDVDRQLGIKLSRGDAAEALVRLGLRQAHQERKR